MKKVLLITSFILLIPIILVSILFYKKTNRVNVVIDNTKQIKLIKEQEEKEKELAELKDANKDLVNRYEKVKKWNEEITYYFD